MDRRESFLGVSSSLEWVALLWCQDRKLEAFNFKLKFLILHLWSCRKVKRHETRWNGREGMSAEGKS